MLKPSTYDEQVKQTSSWFLSLNQCNRTSVLCSLIDNVTDTQAKFLSLVLDNRLKHCHNTQELSRMESDANNPAFLSSLHNETEEVALKYLLSHILLLHPGNSEARSEYLKLLTKILFSSEDEEYLYQCRQLLSLALIHPAFPHEEREKINFWLTRLEEKRRKIMEKSLGEHVNGYKHNPYVNLQVQSLPRNSSPQSSPLKKIYQMHTSSSIDENNKSNTLNGSRIYITLPQPSNGLPTSGFETFDPMGEVNTYPSDSDYDFVQKGFTSYNNSATLSHLTEHCITPDSFKEYVVRSRNNKKSVTLPLQRPSSVCSLPATMDDQSDPAGFLKAGMKDVPGWLRTLRLHKYQSLFADMSYDELLSTTEEFLESKDVTKGAKNKLILSIRKLHKRQEMLAEIDQDLEKPGNLLVCITELIQILQTPIKPYQSLTENSTTGLPSDDKNDECQHENSGHNSANSSPEGSPRHGRSHNSHSGGVAGGDDGVSSGDSSSCSSPPSSPRLNRSSSLSSIDDILAKDFSQEDLPSLILKGLGKIFNQLMMHVETNEENLSAFIRALDIAICHEGFKVSHKRMFFGWKQQCQQTLLVISPRKQPRNRGWSNSYTIAATPSHPNVSFERARNGRRVNVRGSNGSTSMQGSRVGSSSSLLGSPRSVSTLPRANPRHVQQPLPPPYYPPRSRSSSLNSVPTPVPPQIRAHRYVNLPITSPSEVSEMYMDETHELCKSVTEHALEDQ